MLHNKGLIGKARFGKERMVLQGNIDLVDEPFVRSFRHATLLIKKPKQSHLGLNQINARLVVLVVNERPIYSLANIFLRKETGGEGGHSHSSRSGEAKDETNLLLKLKDVLHKLLLELFIGVVDAKLFKAVDLENLEAINVEEANEELRATGWMI